MVEVGRIQVQRYSIAGKTEYFNKKIEISEKKVERQQVKDCNEQKNQATSNERPGA